MLAASTLSAAAARFGAVYAFSGKGLQDLEAAIDALDENPGIIAHKRARHASLPPLDIQASPREQLAQAGQNSRHAETPPVEQLARNAYVAGRTGDVAFLKGFEQGETFARCRIQPQNLPEALAGQDETWFWITDSGAPDLTAFRQNLLDRSGDFLATPDFLNRTFKTLKAEVQAALPVIEKAQQEGRMVWIA